MDCNPKRENDKEVSYCAPWRNEKEPNLSVDKCLNVWFDHVIKKGGKPLQLIRQWLEYKGMDASIRAALRWSVPLQDYLPRITPVEDNDDLHQWNETDPSLKLIEVKPLQKNGLIKYGESRGIPLKVLKDIFEEVYFLNKLSKTKNYALGIQNESGGYEVRHPFFKGCIGPRDIIYIRGKAESPQGINIFEVPLDYATAITLREGRKFDDDSIILCSLNCLDQASVFIKSHYFKNCYTWMDNDGPGRKATKSWENFCKTVENLVHVPMNEQYKPFKDVNAHHMAALEL